MGLVFQKIKKKRTHPYQKRNEEYFLDVKETQREIKVLSGEISDCNNAFLCSG